LEEIAKLEAQLAATRVLSGFATPIANMAQVVQVQTRASPDLCDRLCYFLNLLRSLFLEGMPLGFLVASRGAPLAEIHYPLRVKSANSETESGANSITV
jgi:hypothetical protein